MCFNASLELRLWFHTNKCFWQLPKDKAINIQKKYSSKDQYKMTTYIISLHIIPCHHITWMSLSSQWASPNSQSVFLYFKCGNRPRFGIGCMFVSASSFTLPSVPTRTNFPWRRTTSHRHVTFLYILSTSCLSSFWSKREVPSPAYLRKSARALFSFESSQAFQQHVFHVLCSVNYVRVGFFFKRRGERSAQHRQRLDWHEPSFIRRE